MEGRSRDLLLTGVAGAELADAGDKRYEGPDDGPEDNEVEGPRWQAVVAAVVVVVATAAAAVNLGALEVAVVASIIDQL